MGQLVRPGDARRRRLQRLAVQGTTLTLTLTLTLTSNPSPSPHPNPNQVSNGEFLEFVKDGGYHDQRYWTAEGWGWRVFRNVKWPTFWTRLGLGLGLGLNLISSLTLTLNPNPNPKP